MLIETSFPGIVVRYGLHGLSTFPRCGCDACAEDVADVAAALISLIEGIAEHGLRETRVHARWPRGPDQVLTERWSSEPTGPHEHRATVETEGPTGPAGVTMWTPWLPRAGAPRSRSNGND